MCSALGLLATACPSGGHFTPEEKEELIGGSGSCDALPIFDLRCSGSSCHGPGPGPGGGPLAGGVDLVSPGIAARLYDQPGQSDACKDDPSPLLDPTNVDNSMLLTKLLSTHTCGEPMPMPNPPNGLSEEELACVRSWLQGIIRDGVDATDNGGDAGGADGATDGADGGAQ